MPKVTRSHVDSRGHAYFKKTGRYNEVTREAMHTADNNATSSLKQKKLTLKSRNSGAIKTTKKLMDAFEI